MFSGSIVNGQWNRYSQSGKQPRVTKELDQRVAHRTGEFAAPNGEPREDLLKEQSLAAENSKACGEIIALEAVENAYPPDEIRKQHNFEEILGNGPELLKLLDHVELAAPVDANVLISGETGLERS